MTELATLESTQERVELFPRFFNIGLEKVEPAVGGSTQKSVLVVEAEMPGLRPEAHVNVSFDDGRLHIQVVRERETADTGDFSELLRPNYDMFSCDLILPEGTNHNDILSNYVEGVLQVRVSLPKSNGKATTIPIALRAKWV